MLDHAEQRRAHREELRLVGMEFDQDDEVRQQIQAVGGESEPDIFAPEGFDGPQRGGECDGERGVQSAESGGGKRDDDANSKPAEQQGRVPACGAFASRQAQEISKRVVRHCQEDDGVDPFGDIEGAKYERGEKWQGQGKGVEQGRLAIDQACG